MKICILNESKLFLFSFSIRHLTFFHLEIDKFSNNNNNDNNHNDNNNNNNNNNNNLFTYMAPFNIYGMIKGALHLYVIHTILFKSLKLH